MCTSLSSPRSTAESYGKQGPVEHIHKGLLFIHNRRHLENGGTLCVKARQCTTLGGSQNGSDTNGGPVSSLNALNLNRNVLQSPRRESPYAPQGGGHGGSGYGGGRREDSLVGRSVKIRLGPFKRYRGRVVDATASTCRIELESQMKVVTMRRDQLSEPGETQTRFYSNHRESPQYGAGSETPMHPSRTPMHHPAYMTPMQDSNFGTPSHNGMRTPMRDRAWNLHTPMTLHRELENIKVEGDTLYLPTNRLILPNLLRAVNLVNSGIPLLSTAKETIIT